MKVGKTRNSYRILGLVVMENSPPRAPYIEGEIWGNLLCTKLKEGIPSEINFAQFQRNPQPPNPHCFIKAPLNAHSVYRSDPRHPIKILMTVHLVCWNARSVLWAGKEALMPIGEQDSTGHAIGSRASKSSSSPEELDSRILRGYCRAKGSGDPGLFHIRPMVYAEEEEMSKNEQWESRLPGYTAEDYPVLGRAKSRKGKEPCRQRQSPRAF